MKKSKAVLDYHDDNFAIVFAAMGVRGAGQVGKFWTLWVGSLVSLGPWHGLIWWGRHSPSPREAVRVLV